MHLLRSPLVDLTTVNGVQSLFKDGPVDPHARTLAGQLGNLIAYAGEIRFPLPVRCDRRPDLPALLGAFTSRDSRLLVPVEFSTAERVALAQDYLEPAFEQFAAWSIGNASTLKKTIALHTQPWIRNGHDSRVQQKYVFDVGALESSVEFLRLQGKLGVPVEMIFYSFDVALRYSLYGDLAGENEYYIAHPMRDAIKLPTQTESNGRSWAPCIDFACDVAAIAPTMSADNFAAFLLELRAQVVDSGLQALGPGDVDRDVVRDIASRLGLQSRFRHASRKLGVVGGLLSAAGGFPTFGVPAAIIGGAVAVAASVWTGHVPRQLGNMRWLRWTVRFDVEDQVRLRE